MTFMDKFLCFWACALLVLAVMFLSYDPPKKYRLPNGDIIECTEMVETSQGNFHLKGCTDGTEYFVQGTLEVL